MQTLEMVVFLVLQASCGNCLPSTAYRIGGCFCALQTLGIIVFLVLQSLEIVTFIVLQISGIVVFGLSYYVTYFRGSCILLQTLGLVVF